MGWGRKSHRVLILVYKTNEVRRILLLLTSSLLSIKKLEKLAVNAIKNTIEIGI